MASEKQQSAFSTEITYDDSLNSTVLALSYTDPQDSARSMLAAVAPDLGSNLFRWRVGDHEIIYCEPALLKQKQFIGDFVLWPLPNRVRDKRYSYQGREYSLADLRRPGGNQVLIHGLVFDRPWQFEQPVITSESASVRTYIEMHKQSPYYEMYPFESRLTLTYTLSREGLSIQYEVENKGERDLPYGFALHPYFSRLAQQETYVSLPARSVMEADRELLPTGRVLGLDGEMYAMFDLRQPVPVRNLKLDHVYTDLEPEAHAIIDYRALKMQLHITGSAEFTHAVIFTPPDSEAFFCLEHQTCSTDAINLFQQGEEGKKIAHLLEVHPDEIGRGSLHYRITFQ